MEYATDEGTGVGAIDGMGVGFTVGGYEGSLECVGPDVGGTEGVEDGLALG